MGSWMTRFQGLVLTMKPAFGFGRILPPTGAWVLSRHDGSGAMGASDAGIVPVMQLVIGHVVLANVCPDLVP